MLKKEIYWFLGTLLFTFLGYGLFFGFRSLGEQTMMDVNIHDTYYVFNTTHALVPFAIIIFFVIYLIRVFVERFRNKTVNLIVMGCCILLALMLTVLMVMVHSALEISPNTEDSPIAEQILQERNDSFQSVYHFLWGLQGMLLLLLSFMGIQTGKKNN